MAAEREQWERVQTKTFTNWVNSHLIKRGRKIANLETDLRSGVELINLLEVIGDEKIAKFVANPKMRIQEIENMGKALKFIENHDVKLASIGAEDIVDGNLKLTLGLIWTIILRFAIVGLSEEGLSAKEGLLLWCRRKTEPYDNVDVQDFTVSFQDGLALCALIHRHRPDLIDYASLSNEDKLGNLNLAFNVAHDHLDVPKLLDAEDIVSMPRPDERSIMTYVAQLYGVFSKLDKVETAGRRVGKLTDFKKSVDQLQHDYESRTSALNDALLAKINELSNAGLSDSYDGARGDIKDFRDYKATERREWIAEQAELSALYGNIQAKLKLNNLPAYASPVGLAIVDVESNIERLAAVEKERRTALNANLRNILEQLRRNFADPANSFYESLSRFRAALAVGGDVELDQQLNQVKQNNAELHSRGDDLASIRAAEDACVAANIEENEYTDHTYDDLAFEYERLGQAYQKQINFIESQIASRDQDGVSAAQIEEFKETYNHFDADRDGALSRLEFKSCLSSLGVVELDFEGGDKKFDEIFKAVSAGGESVSFDQFVTYMVGITQDTTSPEQLRDAFHTLAGGKDFVTEQDFRVAQMSTEQIEYLKSVLPPYQVGDIEAYDFKAWLGNMF